MKTEQGILKKFSAVFILSSIFVAAQAPAASDTEPQRPSLQRINMSAEPLDELKLKSEQWDTTRHGEQLVQLPVLKSVVKAWSSMQDAVIELRYPGGEEGELWVRELMDWLISLGIPSQYLVAVPGSGEADVIKFKIIKSGESYR